MKFLEKMVEANINHYNDHPVNHSMIGIAWLVVSGVVVKKVVMPAIIPHWNED